MRGKLIPILAAFIIILSLVYILINPEKPQNSTVSNQQVQPVVEEKKVRVYTLKSDVSLGNEIKRSDISIDWISEQQAEDNAILDEFKIDFTQKTLARINLIKGDILYPENLVTSKDEDYIDFIILPDHIPYPLEVNSSSIVGGVIRESAKIDILALSSNKENLAEREELSSNGFTGVSLTPVLININVLKIDSLGSEEKVARSKRPGETEDKKSALILELTPKQVATLTVAKKIAQLVVHKSLGVQSRKELSADAGDILENYKAIKEFRAEEAKIN